MNEEIRKSVMQKKEENRKRLERCKTCTRPKDEVLGLCPGNMGIGCLGDWRCCNEIYSVCVDCEECKEYWYCENYDCEKMKKFRNGEK